MSTEENTEVETTFDERYPFPDLDGLIDEDGGPAKKEESVETPEEEEAGQTEDIAEGFGESEEEETPETEEEEPAKTEESDEDDGEEEDYDSSPSKKSKEKEQDLDKVPETIARKMAKENGRRAKELQAQLTEKEVEFNRVQEELEQTRAKLQKFETVKIDPKSHPDYKAINDEIWDDVDSTEELLPTSGKTTLGNQIGPYISSYLKAKVLQPEERKGSMKELRNRIVDDLGSFDLPYDELMDDEKRTADDLVNKVLNLVQRNAPKTKKLQDISNDLEEKAKRGQLEHGVTDYAQKVNTVLPVFAAFAEITEEVIEADPYAPESVVAKKIKEDPDYQRRFKRVEKDVIEAFFGPKPYTQKELDDMELRGTDLQSHHKERNKSFEAKRQKMISLLAQSLMTRAEDKELRRELAELKRKKESEESEMDALDKIKPKKGKEPEKKKFEGPARNRPLPTAILFGSR